MRMPLRHTLLFIAALTLVGVPSAHARERSEVETRYQWDLTALYPSDAAWKQAKDDIGKRIPAFEKYRGHLGTSAAGLYQGLSAYMELTAGLERLGTYASQRADEDERVSATREMREASQQLYVQFGSATAFVRPELLRMSPAKVKAFVAAEPRLKPYAHYLDDLLRYAPHTRTASEEQLIAQAGRLEFAGGTIRSVFNNAELPWPTVTLSDGSKVRLDDAAYTQYRQSPVRADRDTVFRVFWRTHTAYAGTYGAALNAGVQSHIFEKEARHFSSCLEAAQFGDAIPASVYHQLIDDVHANLPTLHRYLKLRARMMGVSQLRYEDLYAPLVKDVDLHYTPEQAMDLVLKAVAPLGKPYVDTLAHGYASRWIDWMPTTGKASGAYSTGAYGVHPFQLQNFTGLYDEVGTLAHESGHSMHTYMANRNQPYVTHDYATFVAEVASTLNENLLFHYMLDHTTDKATRLSLLGSQLDNLRGTLFRQAMFAEFELAMHEKAERGENLSGESLSQLYLGIVRRYYGHDLGVCAVDSLYSVEWAYIPHFFRDFYVYQYATSIVASTALANGIREDEAHGGTAKRDAYLHMLASGSSRYPIELLRDAGVDMTTPAPFQAAMHEMNAVMDEMDKLLAQK